MNITSNNISPESAAIIAAFSSRLTDLVKRKKAKAKNVKLLVEDEEIAVPQEFISYLNQISREKNEKAENEISVTEAIILMDISMDEMQNLISKNAISHRKAGDEILISRKEAEKYAEKLLQKRLKGMEKIIKMQQETGLYE